MATRSTISIKEGKQIRTIYCHWDGYPSNNGALLLKHYQDEEKVKRLIDLGDISSLAPMVSPDENTIHVKSQFTSEGRVYTEYPNVPHTFETPHKDVVVAYGRDRGETNIEPRICENERHIPREEFEYLFKDGKWYVQGVGGSGFVLLTPLMCR